jgi:uncharacterized Fe-S cluster protein YjdI
MKQEELKDTAGNNLRVSEAKRLSGHVMGKVEGNHKISENETPWKRPGETTR